MPSVVQRPAIGRARQLRRDTTDGEKRLWQELREFRRLYGIHFRRQVPIGPHVADFAAHSVQLVIEVDGHFHEEACRAAMDFERDGWLSQAGYRVLRFRTGELHETLDGCVEEILRELGIMR